MTASTNSDARGPTLPGPRLPIELTTMILQSLRGDFKTLASTALVNKALCEESRRLLYRNVGHPSRKRSPRADTIALLINPSLAKYVHSYALAYAQMVAPPVQHTAPLAPGPALDAMVNLEHLDLTLYRRIPNNFLEGCPFQLESFSWIDCAFGWEKIYSFFQTQKKLRKLEFDASDGVDVVHSFPLPACPNLEYLRSTPDFIQAALPGRNITILGFVVMEEEIELNFDHLSKELSQIKALSFLATPESPRFSSISKDLYKNLQYLEMFPADSEVLEALPQFISLVGLIFPTHPEMDDDLSYLQAPEETGRFFVLCPTLQFVDIQANDHPIDRKFERWVPGTQRDVGKKLSEECFFSSDIEDHLKC
ncbi:hypothetical protein NLJ89_g6006 [Agrocybe chaxingu]|uniref:F-box domain-containing protein n=1 Tax=Agrocybe chaxingu TaxID=84603 RepID=A0A9W8MWF7_9AGAR|nr:hypothetical protein NLJ89_g6006 [Agrocybe chaxingu]